MRNGQSCRGRRVLFATGVCDALPSIEGLEERWGRSVYHCPYCHGYELDQGRVGVIGSGSMSAHQAELLTEWGDVTFLPNGAVSLDDETRRRLEGCGVTLEEAPIKRVVEEADVALADGRVLSFAGLFVATTVSPASPLSPSQSAGRPPQVPAQIAPLIPLQTDRPSRTSSDARTDA